ncbi:MAG: AcrB/AcrD/AcrF family protein [Propionibacteriales bacterium]|nr:AcrB/AcrD/AcrF family protein [Propionibacteriales bacterium]
MLSLIVGSSMRFRLLVVLIVGAVLAFGVSQLRSARVDALPEFSPPYVQIQTEALGLSATEVEQLITVPLEADLLNGVAWLQDIRSESVPGLSSIELFFEPGTDLYRARQMVGERLVQSHALPNVSKPPVMLQPVSSTGRVMIVGLTSEQLSLIDMSVLARWKIKPRLMGVPGVANVAIWGQRERQMQVQVDSDKLREHGVSLDQVIRTTGNALWVSPLSFVEASTPGTGGFVDTPSQRLGVQHILPIRTPEDLDRITLEGTDGERLTLGDVSSVVQDHQPLIGDALVDDNPSLMLVIEKFPGTSTTEVTHDLEDALTALEPGLSGVEIDTSVYRPATFIESAIDNIGLTLLVGLVLLVVLLGAVFLAWRTALICLLTIPLSLLVAALVLHLRDATFNAAVLAGLVLAVAVVVDDAVVDVDAIRRRLSQQGGAGRSALLVVKDASLAVRGPLMYATVIAVLAVVPLLAVDGITGALMRPIVVSYLLAVAASLAVALTVTPALSLLLLANAPERREPAAARWLRDRYRPVIGSAIRKPLPVLAVAGVAAVAGLVVLPQISAKSVLPPPRDRDLLVHWDGAPGTSHPEMSRITAEASRELRALPGVDNVAAHVGRAVSSDQVVGINSGELWVSLDRDASYDDTVAAVNDVVSGYPGITPSLLTYPEESISELSPDNDEPLVVRVYGQDLDVLAEKAEEAREILANVEGVTAPRVDVQPVQPTVEIEVDLAAAQRSGIKPGDVRRSATTMLSGIEAGNLFEDQKVFEVVVWGAPDTRHSLSSIRDLPIDTPTGRVPLADLADVRITPNQTAIRHDAVFRVIDVVADVDGRSLDSVVADAKQQLTAVEFPLEHHLEVLPGDGAQQEGGLQPWMLGAAAAVLAFLLLQAALSSWRLAALVFVTLPLALTGGAVAIFLLGGDTSYAVLLALLAVLGLTARHSIMLVGRYQVIEHDEGRFDPEQVHRGSAERFVPTVVTLLAISALLLPFAVSWTVAGHEVLHPVSVVVLGGLLTSALVTMFVLPVLYLRIRPTVRSGTPRQPQHTGPVPG